MKLSYFTFILMLLVLASVSAISQPTPSPSSDPTATPSPQSSPNPNTLTQEDRNEIFNVIVQRDDIYERRWNGYRIADLGSTLLAALLAALAGLLPKLKPVNPDDPDSKKKQSRNENVSLILAATATFLLLVNTTWGFSGLAIANRTARDEIRVLKADILDRKVVSFAAVVRKLDEIESKRSNDPVK